MGFETAFLDMLPATIKVSTRTGHSFSGGAATFASSTTSYRARIVQKQGYIRGPDGESIEVSHVAWVRSTAAATITVNDRVTLPSSVAQSTRPPLLAVERYPDTEGVHHTKLYFGF